MQNNTELLLRSLNIVKGPKHYVPRTIDFMVNLVRKKLGLKEIPTIKEAGLRRLFHLIGISIVPIGIKEDEFKMHDFADAAGMKKDTLKYGQEML